MQIEKKKKIAGFRVCVFYFIFFLNDLRYLLPSMDDRTSSGHIFHIHLMSEPAYSRCNALHFFFFPSLSVIRLAFIDAVNVS